MALLWAAGIIWFAYDVAGSTQQDRSSGNSAADVSGNGSSTDQQNKVAELLGS